MKNPLRRCAAIVFLIATTSFPASAIEPNLGCDGSVIEVEGLPAPVAPDRGTPPEGLRPLLVEIRLEITELNQID